MLKHVYNLIKTNKVVSHAELQEALIPMSAYGLQLLLNQLLAQNKIKKHFKEGVLVYKIKRWYEW